MELESIRGLAALLVVFYHIPKWNPILDIGLINNSYLMVDLFFVLSGFVIFNAYANTIATGKDLLRFQILRLGRLYPVHLLFLLLFLGIEIAKYVATAKLGTQDIRVQPFAENSLNALVQQLFLLQAIGPTGNILTFNGPAWSISVEFYTYLIFALIVLFLKPLKTYVFFAVAGIAITLLMTKTTFGSDELLHGIAGFFIGCITASAIKKTNRILPPYLTTLCFISILLFLTLKSADRFDVTIYFLTATLIASLMLSPTGHLKAMLRHKTLAWLGRISYSIYMSHSFVLWGVANIFKRLLNRPETLRANGKWVLSLSTGETCIAILAIFALVLLVSQATYTLIENPLRRKSRHFVFGKLPLIES